MKNIKDLLVDYTSNKIRRREVSIQDIMEVMDKEFPEFLREITRAYYQAGYDDASKPSIVEDVSGGHKFNKRNKKKDRRDGDEPVYR